MNNLDLENSFANKEGPRFLSLEKNALSYHIALEIPKDLSWFEGHFPEHPVLPGVVQVDWAGTLAKQLFTDLGAFNQLANVKFKTMVLPGTTLSLQLDYNEQKKSIKFHYFNDDASFSNGTLHF